MIFAMKVLLWLVTMHSVMLKRYHWFPYNIWCLIYAGVEMSAAIARWSSSSAVLSAQTDLVCLHVYACKHTKGTYKGRIIHTQQMSRELNNVQQTLNFPWNQFQPYAYRQKRQIYLSPLLSLLAGAQSCRHTHRKYLGRLSQYPTRDCLFAEARPQPPSIHTPFSLCAPLSYYPCAFPPPSWRLPQSVISAEGAKHAWTENPLAINVV